MKEKDETAFEAALEQLKNNPPRLVFNAEGGVVLAYFPPVPRV